MKIRKPDQKGYTFQKKKNVEKSMFSYAHN